MLLIEIPRVPPEGLAIDESLDPAKVHLEDDDDLVLDGGHLRCRVELVDGTTVHVRGDLDGRVTVECGRCLDRYPVEIEQRMDMFYLPRLADRPEDEEEEVELDDHDVVVGYYDEEKLDLGEVVREQILLALPLKRLCRPDCRGLCQTCGRNRNTDSCSCAEPEEPVDPRLEPLRKLVGPDHQ